MKTATTPVAMARAFAVREWKPYAKNTLIGFVSIELSSGMILHGFTLHQKNGSRWVGLPARHYEKGSEKTWAPLVEFDSKEAREKFQACAQAAIDAYLGEGLE